MAGGRPRLGRRPGRTRPPGVRRPLDPDHLGRPGQSEAGLHDYANREWDGLVRDLYAPRWAAYFAGLDTALATGTAPAAVDWFARDDAWAREHRRYPTAPAGDPYALAEEVREVLAAASTA